MTAEYTGKDNLDAMKEAVNYNAYLNELIAEDMHPNDLIIDFGAGSGTFAQPLKDAGRKVICVETDAGLASSLAEAGHVVVRNMEQIQDASIDRIYSLNVLEHIEDDQAILNLWFRKLKPGGKILIYVPAFQMLYSKMDEKVCHVRRYSKPELKEKVEKAGFKVTGAEYADSLGFLATLVYKMTSSGGVGDINTGMLKIYDKWVFPVSKFLDLFLHAVLGKNVVVRAQKGAA